MPVINRVELKNALGLAVRVMEKKGTIPVLSCVNLTFGSELRIHTTNLDQSFETTIPCQSETKETTNVDGKLLNDIVNRLSEDNLNFEIDTKNLIIRRSKGDIKVRRTHEEFPTMPSVDDVKSFAEFKASDLCASMHAMLCGTEEDRTFVEQFRNFILLAGDGTTFTCFATDKNKMAITSGDYVGEPCEFQIPVYVARLLTSLQDGNVKIGQTDNHIFVVSDDLRYAFRRTTVKFPDVNALLKNLEPTKFASGSAETIATALELVRTMADPRLNSIKWELNGNLTLSTGAADIGTITETVDVASLINVVAGYNILFLIPIFKQFQGEVELGFVEQKSGDLVNTFLRVKQDDTHFYIGSMRIS